LLIRRLLSEKTRDYESQKYENIIKEGPTTVCACCGGLFFSRSLQIIDPIDINHQFRPLVFNEFLYPSYSTEVEVNIFFCYTCNTGIKNDKVPKIALTSGLMFNTVDDCLNNLNDLEERLVSPRIAFMRIRPLGWDGQKGMIGNVVNVPIDIQESLQSVLPRHFDDTHTMQLNLKRKMEYKKAYMCDEINPSKVLKAIRYLITQDLFKLKDIEISKDWLSEYDPKNLQDPFFMVPFIVEKEDELFFKEPFGNKTNKASFNSSGNKQILSDDDNHPYQSQMYSSSQMITLSNQKTVSNSSFFSNSSKEKSFSTRETTLNSQNSNRVSQQSIKKEFLLTEINKRYERDDSDDSNSENEGLPNYFASNNRNFQNQNTLLTCGVNIAPAEGNEPDFFVDDPYSEELQFLKIYGGQICKYPEELSYQARCKSEFRRYDRRCALNVEKIFYSYKKLTQIKLREAMNTALKKKTIRKDGDHVYITAAMAKDQGMIKRLQEEDEAFIFLRAVRSTPQFWEWKKFEINAMIRQFGIPSFFITFSPSEINWPELIVVLVFVLDHVTITIDEAMKKYNRKQRLELVNRDPVTVTRYFENRMRALLKFAHSKSGVFAKAPITDYFWRVDFQYRGSPHVHMLTWNSHHPVYRGDLDDDPVEKQKMSEKYSKFVQEYCTCARPDNEIVEEETIYIDNMPKRVNINFQLHSHRQNCLFRDTKQNQLCKYNFPMPIMNETVTIEPFDKDQKNGEQLYDQYYDLWISIRQELDIVVEQTLKNKDYRITLEDFLKDNMNNLDYEDYLKALSCPIKRITVYLKRKSNELMVNQYNKEIYLRHRANMDIQPVTDPYGAASYVSAYMLKTNLVTSKILRKVQKENEKGNMSLRTRLSRIANKFQNVHEVSAPEAVYTLLSMPVAHASRETIYINTFPLSKRINMLMDREMLEQIQDDSLDIWKKNLLNHYENRADSMEDVCLAEFAAWYTYVTNAGYAKATKKLKSIPDKELDERDDDEYNLMFEYQVLAPNIFEEKSKSQQVPEDNSEDEEEKLENFLKSTKSFIKLKNKDGFVQKRKRARILRYKRYNRKSDPANFIRVQNMLYIPWRNEEKEIELELDIEKITLKYRLNYDIIEKNRTTFEVSDIDTIEEIQKEVEDVIKRQNEDDNEKEADKKDAIERILRRQQLKTNRNIDGEVSDDNEEDQDNENIINNYIQGSINVEHLEDLYGYHADVNDIADPIRNHVFEKNVPLSYPKRISDRDYYELMSRLNPKQQIYIMNFINDMKSGQQFCHFIRGGSGTGKSFLIKAIYQTLIRYYQPEKLRPDETPDHSELYLWCLVCALTGKAAFNIGGDTTARVFRMQFMEKVFHLLSESNCKKLQDLYKKVVLIIIDEISMIGTDSFSKYDSRMRQIRGNQRDFMGGLSIIVVGDFNQLQPIGEQSIFNVSRLDGYASLVDNPKWSKFKLWELTTIMRQTGSEKDFAIALNKLGDDGLAGLSNKQVELFNSRLKSLDEIPNEAVFLFHENKDVHIYNKKRINNVPGELFTCTAIDKLKGQDSESKSAQKELEKAREYKLDVTNGMPFEILFKINCKYMITTNQDVEDGLVNGTTGILKSVVTRRINDDDDSEILNPKRLWFDFIDKEIGKKARLNLKFRDYYSHDNIIHTDKRVKKEWTPIEYLESTIKSSERAGRMYKIVRIQYPLVPCEAITIHKAQGQTYTMVAVSLEKNMKLALLYVALSRVTTLGGLYLFGRDNILTDDIIRMSDEQKKAAIQKHNDKDATKREMKRLRESCLLENRFIFMNENFNPYDRSNGLCFTIMFQNILRLSEKKVEILNKDLGFQNADLIHFVSTCLNTRRSINTQLNRYMKIYESKSSHLNSSNGQTTYISNAKHLRTNIVYHNADQNTFLFDKDTNAAVEICIIEYVPKDMYELNICMVYKHPAARLEKLIDEIKTGLNSINFNKKNHYKSGLIIIGDMNIDFNKEKAKLGIFERNLQVKVKFTETPTNDKGNQLDWVFTNMEGRKGVKLQEFVYESWISDHKPIYLQIKYSK